MIAALLSLYHYLFVFRDQQLRHVWKNGYPVDTIIDKRILVIGTGDIGVNFARRVSALGGHPIGIHRTSAAVEGFEETYALEDLDRELPLADVVAICIPGTEESRDMFDERRLHLMKPDAILLNVGRGFIVNSNALKKVLDAGLLRGAILDVTDPEPLPADDPLWDYPNVFISPHDAGNFFSMLPLTRQLIFDICERNIRHILNGEPVENQVMLK